MPRESFQTALSDLREAVLDLGELVLERLETALAAFVDDDEALANRIIGSDDEVNRRYLELESRCIELFALEQPVAADLRLVAASFKIITDLERVGDLAANLAKYTLSRTAILPEVGIPEIGRKAIDMLEAALEAFENRDGDTCRAVAARDDDLDRLCEQASSTLVRNLIERDPIEATGTLKTLLTDIESALLTIRDLERIGDHAVNVAGRTLYVLDGDPELVY
jgi:phosphate transport system protein